ncbi:unnamed protein product [Cunninghamella echinulata]
MEISEILRYDPLPEERPFKCNFENCIKAFGRKSDLVRHSRIHSNDKPYKCSVISCGKRFIQRSALKVHFRTHTGEKPHSCEYCNKRFGDSSSLARHRRTHTGKRQYRCVYDNCCKYFVHKTMLIQHIKYAHKPTSP